MSLEEQLIEKLTEPILSRSERARIRVQLSKVLEESGNYEGAREALGEFWSRIGEHPALNDLNERVAAEVLQQVGVLTSCIGSAKQIEGAQDVAKDLISKSITIFENLRDTKKAAEAQIDLAICYWREGAFDNARAILWQVAGPLTEGQSEVAALALIRIGIVERAAGRLNDALRVYADAAQLFESINNHALKGKYHVGYALLLRNLGTAENRNDYIDRALIEYAAASYHFEQAGNHRYCARVENNLGFLFSTIGKFDEAHEHAKRARRIFAELKDKGSVAQVDETRARIFLEESKYEEAERVAGVAVGALERGDERALLAEALTTRGVALARLGRVGQAREVLERAAGVAGEVGDREGAGQAWLALVEELGGRLEWSEVGAAYVRASELLEGAQHRGIKERLVASGRGVIRARMGRGEEEGGGEVEGGAGERFEPMEGWEGFSFRAEVRRYERFLIERALKEAGGVVTRAGQLLGFKHHYSLVVLLNERHKDLLHARSPVVRRKRSVLKPAAPPQTGEKPPPVLKILHVEDNKVVADALRDALQLEGWKVESCADGREAKQKIRGGVRFDLLLLDNELPGASGLQLVRLARRLPHRRRTPIIMLSASDCEPEAWRAGVDAYLRKPDDVLKVAEVAARLMSGKS